MYLKKTWIYRNHIEVKKYHTPRYGVKGEKRQKRKKPLPEAVQKANEKNACDKLRRILINNFDEGDWFLTLTYAEENKPDVQTSRKILNVFLRKLRAEYKKQGIKFKYVMTTEWSGHHIHHHIVLNDIPKIQLLVNKLWTFGGKKYVALYPNEDYDGLAKYLVKETSKTFSDPTNPYRQRYSCSRNLEKPVEKVEVIKANEWAKEPKIPERYREQGYFLDKDSLFTGADPFGYPFQQYMYRRLII